MDKEYLVRIYRIKRIVIKNTLLGIGLIFILSLYGCGKKGAAVSTDWYCTYNNDSYSDSGYFYYDNNFIRYADVESKQDVLICDNPDCRHNKSSCSAAFDATFMHGIIYEDNKLYFISNYEADKLGVINFYQSDVNGENRKKLGTFENIQYIQGVQYYDNYILIIFINSFDDNLEDMDQREAGVYLYDRVENRGKVLFLEKATDACINSVAVIDDTVYFTYFYNELESEQIMEYATNPDYIWNYAHSDLYSVQLEGDKAEKLITNADSNGYIKGKGDRLFYFKDDIFYMYDVPNEEETIIFNNELTTVPTFDNIPTVFRGYDSETKEHIYYQYEDKNSIKEIGRSATDFSPIAVFHDVTYVWYFGEDGNGSRGFFKTDDFLNGKYANFNQFDILD